MTYEFARIDLTKTQYTESVTWSYLSKSDYMITKCQDIYRAYCAHKRFASVMPMFPARLRDAMADVIGYYAGGNLVALA